jgi:hypothetical protein
LKEVSREGIRAIAKIMVRLPLRAAWYPSDHGASRMVSRGIGYPIFSVIFPKRSTDIPFSDPFIS